VVAEPQPPAGAPVLNWRNVFSWRHVWLLPAMIACGIVLLDQWTKRLIITSEMLHHGHQIEVVSGFFNIVYTRNTGAAWGMFAQHTKLLALLSATVLVIVVVGYRRFAGPWVERALAISLVLGGIAGNMIDRIWYDGVIDFLDFGIGIHRWPAFNVADSAICVGVAIYVLSSFIRPEDGPAAPVAKP
jgi:signal peptidase II